MSSSSSNSYFVRRNDSVTGPITGRELRRMAAAGEVRPEHEVSQDQAQWVLARKVRGLFDGEGSAPGGRQYAFDVFISYSSQNKLEADVICGKLEAAGIRCWIAPRNIHPGEEYGEAIINGIDRSRIMVLIFSDHANNSPQVRREVERAISKQLTLLPIRLVNTPPTKAMEYCLGNTHWLDAFDPPLERHIQPLLEAVRGLLGHAAVPRPAPVAMPVAPVVTQQPVAVLPLIGPASRAVGARRRGWRWVAMAASVALVAAVVFMIVHSRTGSGVDLTDDFARYRQATLTPGGSKSFVRAEGPARYAIWRKAAEKGDAIGQLLVCRCYQEGVGVAKDPLEGFQWAKRSADQGFACGMTNVGWCYVEGAGVAKSDEQFFQWSQRAAEKGDLNGMNNLGSAYQNGTGTTKSIDKAIEWYRKAADGGLPIAAKNLALIYMTDLHKEKWVEGAKWYAVGEKLGDASAALELGRCYRNGWGVTVDETAAYQHVDTAAKLGSADAQTELSEMYAMGSGVQRDVNLAVEWGRKAVAQATEGPAPRAHRFALARALALQGKQRVESGLLVDAAPCLEEAVKLFTTLRAECGYNNIYRNNLAMIHYTMSRAAAEARDLPGEFRNAAIASSLGNQDATKRLSEMYAAGIYVGIDATKAAELSRRASKQVQKKFTVPCYRTDPKLEVPMDIWVTEDVDGTDSAANEKQRLKEDYDVQIAADYADAFGRGFLIARENNVSFFDLVAYIITDLEAKRKGVTTQATTAPAR